MTFLLIPQLQNLGYEVVLITVSEVRPHDFVLPNGVEREIIGSKRYDSLSQIIQKYKIDTVILQDYWRPITCWDLLYFS